MPRLRSALIGLVLLAALPRTAASAGPAATEDVPVPGGTTAFATALAIVPTPDRGRFMFELTRLIHDNPESRNPATQAFIRLLANHERRRQFPLVVPNAGKPDQVPVPLDADLWGRAVFRRTVAREDLVASIVGDRIASLLCHGLTALDDPTLAFFGDHESLLARLGERSAPLFAAFSANLRVRSGRVVPPGDDAAVPFWEAVVGEKVTRPERFIQQLFEINDGRVAYLYDTIGQLDAPHRAFALGLWLPAGPARLERFKALTTSAINTHREWHARAMPFNRASYDPAMTLFRVSVEESGRPSRPASRAFWDRVFSGADLSDDPARLLRGVDDEPFDAAWLIESISGVDVRQRVERLDQLTFAQRVFSKAETDPDVFIAARAAGRYRMLALGLERAGIVAPAVYAAAARQAAHVGSSDGHRGFLAQAQFQGALALILRIRAVRTVDTPAAQKLIEQVAALPFVDGRFNGGVAEWMGEKLVPLLRAADTTEDALVAALGGAATGADTPPVITWEGHRYRLDLGAAERQRLRRVRERQGGVPIDVALDLSLACRRLRHETPGVDDLESIGVRLARLVSAIPERPRDEGEDSSAAGTATLRDARATLEKAAEDLARAVKNKDTRRAPRIAEPLVELTDELMAQALLSFAYAAHAGDPDGALLLVDDVSRRHDFGLSAKDSEQRTRLAWMAPRQEVAPATPWHIAGSLIGLDVGLASTALRRVNYERVLEAPRMTSNQRDGFAISVSLMDPYALSDQDRDTIAAAIAQGASRASRIAGDEDLDAAAELLSIEPWRRRALRWTLAHEPDRLPSLFSATDLLVLGGGRPSDLDPWGMTILPLAGCLCPRLLPPGRWSSLVGRPQLGLTAAGIADVNLLVAIRLKELNLPAALARVVLSAAMQDFLDEARPTDDADWVTLVQRARRLTREQVEDYVAAATANGPLVPEEGQ